MDAWLQDVRHAGRALRRRPGYAVVATLTLALGIGANTAIFSVMYGAILRPLQVPEADRLIDLSDKFETWEEGGASMSVANFMDLKERSRTVESMSAYVFSSFNFSDGQDPRRIFGARVQHDFFDVLGVPMALGRGILPEDDVDGAPPVAVLSHGLWQEVFAGDPDVLGETITLNAVPHTVVGVTPASFEFPYEPRLWIPVQWSEQQRQSRGGRGIDGLGRLAPGVSVDAARAELTSIFAELESSYPEQNEGWTVWVQPFPEWALGRAGSLYLLAGAAALVLLIACVNVANLMIARSEVRQRELAVRAALGAGRGRLVRHFLSESLLVAALGGVAGVAIAFYGVPVLVSLYGSSLPRSDDIAISGTILAFALGVAVVTGLVVGFFPAFRVNPDQLQQELREGSRGASRGGSRLRRGLVVSEIALAVMLVAGAGLLVNSYWRLSSIDLGVELDDALVFAVQLPSARYQESADITGFWTQLVAELERLPSVEHAGITTRTPLNGGSNVTNLWVPGDPEPRVNFVEVRGVSPGIFPALGVPLQVGRMLDASDADSAATLLINEELARQAFGDENPIGKRINPGWRDEGYEVVGVVGDMLEMDVGRDAAPALYAHFESFAANSRTMTVTVRTAGDPLAAIPTIRETVRGIDPQLPIYAMRTLEDIALQKLGSRRFAMSLLALFAGVALVLGAVGIYGVMSYSVAQRTREVGVRIALGGSTGDVVRMILSQGLKLAVAGVVVGVGASLAAGRVLESLLYEVSTTDPVTYVVVTGVLLGTAVLACWIPARRAARVHPVEALRHE